MQSTRLKQIVSFAIVSAALFTPVRSIFASEQQAGPQRKIFVEGARLWPVYCAQCHNARPGSQFSPAQWDAITMHMRTQSIMPAKDMRAIKEFLKQAR
jgi:mono/diheme cytochrome c family protein